jgi:MFS family permease
MFSFLDKERTIAKPGYNRWLVPPAALMIHLSIGMAYGFSVFWKPLSMAIGITQPAPGDWPEKYVGIAFTLFFVFLGSSAALFGSWLERNGPRKVGVVAAFCWGGGFFISALGVHFHQVYLIWLGSGVIGGCGLGLGYISPVSTLIKWFPDKRGMATGMAIMGFGGGAIIGSPLAVKLMNHYATPTSVGVWQTFVTLGCIYFVAMLCGAFMYRVPAPGWKPHGWTAPTEAKHEMITHGHVHVNRAHRTPQFWLLWGVLCLNVSAGIGIIYVASPLLQEVFGGKLIGVGATFSALTTEQKTAVAVVGGAFAGFLSLFNIFGRFFWASLSDKLGRKLTYHIFFAVGLVLYLTTAHAAISKNLTLFVSTCCVLLTMYGGGFATIPAYLADLFGTQFVGAIHGRLLTAWSTAGIIGPVLVGFLHDFQIKKGVPNDAAYNMVLYVLAGLLFIGFICNLLVRPVAKRHFMSDEELALERKKGHERLALASVGAESVEEPDHEVKPSAESWIKVGIAWIMVGVPLGWGITQTCIKAAAFFK